MMLTKLPDAEFDIMKIVWENEPPITTAEIMKLLGMEREWKIQTVVSFMQRLSERGFLRSEKNGKERSYYPTVSKEEYINFEASIFLKQYHNNSFLSLATAMYEGKALTDEDVAGLRELLRERGD